MLIFNVRQYLSAQSSVFDAENSTVTESEMDTEVDTDRESVVDRFAF